MSESKDEHEPASAEDPSNEDPSNTVIEVVGAAPAPAPEPRAIGFDTNIRMTLVGMSVIGLVALSTWGAARVACNYSPSHSQSFTPAPMERRIERPKNAGLEFHHQLFLQDFEQASDLALEGGIEVVEDYRDACAEKCRAEVIRRREEARTRAILHRVQGMNAWVTAQTFFDGEVIEATYKLERISNRWMVIGYGLVPEQP